MIITGGTIRTLDPSLPRAGGLAIAGAHVVGGVGAHETALPTPERVDLRGRCVLPAFSDSHVHFPTWALSRREVQLDAAASLEEALGRIKEHTAAGTWIRGRGWRDAEWAEKPTAARLDAVTGEALAALWSKDYHSLWLNTAALQLARGDLQLPGGVVERDGSGEPNGILREQSAWTYRDRFAMPPDDEWIAATREGIRVANSRGVAAVHDKDGWLGAPRFFSAIHREEGLTMRVWGSLPATSASALATVRLPPAIGDDYLRVGYLKAFMDGTLGSQTAWLLDGSGVMITSGEELEEIIQAGVRIGWPVSVHAIGDRANREALDAFERTRDLWQPLGLRHRIEHAQCVAREDIPRFAALGIACSVQFTHAPSDRDLAERFWGDRLDGTYAFRSLLESGAIVTNGSDAPVEELDPLAGIRAGVTRTLDGRPPWRADECLTVEQAIHASTVAPAWLAGDERRRGRLVPGMLADLVVLNRDPFECPPDELGMLEVVATMVGGRWVFNPPPWN